MICPYCQEKMQPRLVTWKGRPERSLCPRCGGIVQDFTAASTIDTEIGLLAMRVLYMVTSLFANLARLCRRIVGTRQ